MDMSKNTNSYCTENFGAVKMMYSTYTDYIKQNETVQGVPINMGIQ